MKLNLSSAVRTAKSVITANSPILLVGTAIAGVVTTGILAAKGGYKARGIIDEAELESDVELTVQDKFKLTWLCYAVPAVTGASTIASVLGLHVIHTKEKAALAGLYAMSVNKLDDLREEAEGMLTPKKKQELNDALGQKGVDRDPVSNHEVIILDGNELCRDDFSGRWFRGSHAIIEKALSEVNMQLIETGDANLNEFYDYIGLEPIPLGNRLGWAGERVEPRFGSTTTPDGKAAISFWFHPEPKDLASIR